MLGSQLLSYGRTNPGHVATPTAMSAALAEPRQDPRERCRYLAGMSVELRTALKVSCWSTPASPPPGMCDSAPPVEVPHMFCSQSEQGTAAFTNPSSGWCHTPKLLIKRVPQGPLSWPAGRTARVSTARRTAQVSTAQHIRADSDPTVQCQTGARRQAPDVCICQMHLVWCFHDVRAGVYQMAQV